MSNISELSGCPELNFIENMTLRETEEQLKALYTRYYREITGKEPELGEADPLNLLMKAFAAMEYQTMQYADTKGRMELLKTSTGEALDALGALVGVNRKGPTRATATVRFTLSEARSSVTAIPAGTRVKTEDGKYFNTLGYAEIGAGDSYTDTVVQAEEAGAGSDGLLPGSIKILVDPIPYIASAVNTTESTGGLDTEDDDSLTRRIYLSPSVYSCAGPRDAYEYYAREWRGDVADVRTDSPEPNQVDIYFVIQDEDGLRLPNPTELAEMKAYMSGESMRPLCDQVDCKAPEEVEYTIAFTYWIGASDQKAVSEIQSRVSAAVEEFQTWQRKLGRDINPTELIAQLRAAGAKRVKLTAPDDTTVEKNELPKCTGATATYGGLEDD